MSVSLMSAHEMPSCLLTRVCLVVCGQSSEDERPNKLPAVHRPSLDLETMYQWLRGAYTACWVGG